ncbi:MAG: protein kinase, partial [Planctomycetota bacterium]|nr:protein kinase [Planctomycetota bacterium]
MASEPDPLEGPRARTVRPASGESAADAPRDLAPSNETVDLPPGSESQAPAADPSLAGAPPHPGPDQTQPAPIRKLGPYELVRLIGRGGMGAVWEALDTRLNRRVALKVMVAGAHASEHDTERFRREAQNSAKLRQPHIVPVHDFGVEAGHHYLVMALVDGVVLADALRQRQFTYREKATLLEKVARAVHYAHEQGVIHRDLKPSNIMLEYKTGAASSRRVVPETPALVTQQAALSTTEAPEPLVMDFGLAKDLASDSSLSQSGQVVGTPAYMPPEQAEGRIKDVGPHSDVYSLGAILYEMLTGRAPFTGENLMQILRATTAEDPVPPRQITPGVPRDLETVCLKCLEKKPERRYASAEALADDLNAWLSGDSISARPPTLPERIIKRVRKNPSLYAVSLVALAVIVLGTVAFMLSLDQKRREAEKARDEARAAEGRAQNEKDNALAAQKAEARQRESAEAARRGAELEVYRSGIREADRLSSEGKPSDALAILKALDPRFRGWEYGQLLCRAKRNTYTTLWTGAADGNSSLAFSPDASRLIAGAADGIKVWEATTGRQLVAREAQGSGVSSVAVSPDGRWLARGGRDGNVTLWLAESGTEHLTLKGHTDAVTFMAFSPPGTYLATGSSDKTVRVWEVQTGRELPETKPHEAGVTSLAFSPNGKCLAAGSGNRTIRVWEAETGRELFTLKGHAGPVSAVSFSPDGTQLASAARDRTIRLWDVAAGRQMSAF